MPISEIAAALSALQAAKDIAQAAVGLRDGAAFQSKLIELQSKILDAQSSASAAYEERLSLIEQVRQLKENVARFENWGREKQRYELADVGRGCIAYRLKPEMANGEPPHSICANCYERAEKRHLQPESRRGSQYLVCHECGSELIINGPRDMPLPEQSVNPRRGRF
jgi:hypothetical protein